MLEQTSTRLTKIRFGVFEADLRAGELRKSGIRIKLQSQPFKLLAILLAHAGEIVTREELQQQIWGSETVVNFDHSLGTAVNKVREALGDSAENPHYIETLAKRGYRFIVPIQVLEPIETQPVSTAVVPAIVSFPKIEPEVLRSKSIPRKVSWRLVIPSAATLLALSLAVRLWQINQGVRPTLLKFTQITSSDSIYPGDAGIERFPGSAHRRIAPLLFQNREWPGCFGVLGDSRRRCKPPGDTSGNWRAATCGHLAGRFQVAGFWRDVFRARTKHVGGSIGRGRRPQGGQRPRSRWHLAAGWEDLIVCIRARYYDRPRRWSGAADFGVRARQSILAALRARRFPPAIHVDRFRHPGYFALGVQFCWKAASPAAAGLEQSDRRLLRKLDAGWKVFHLPIEPAERKRYLGAAERAWIGAQRQHRSNLLRGR